MVDLHFSFLFKISVTVTQHIIQNNKQSHHLKGVGGGSDDFFDQKNFLGLFDSPII